MEILSILPDSQCGFRQGKNTTDNLVLLEHEVYKGFKERRDCSNILYLTKAFDRASHTAILYKMCILGMRGRSLMWLKSFFEERYFQVIIGQECSKKYPVKTGVPQGSVLSSLLFTALLYDSPQIPGGKTTNTSR